MFKNKSTMLIPGFFSNASPDYRFGFNGMLRDDDVRDEKLTNDNEGRGNSYSTEYRFYDNRAGRWLSIDPLASKFPWSSPYVAMGNNPVIFVDPRGDAETKQDKGSSEGEQRKKYIERAGGYGETYSSTQNLDEYWHIDQSGNGNWMSGTNYEKSVIDPIAQKVLQSDFDIADYGLSCNLSSKFFELVDKRSNDIWSNQPYLNNGESNPIFKGHGLISNDMDFVEIYGGVKLGITGIKLLAGTGSNFAEYLFLSEKFGISSKHFANSVTGIKGSLNHQGGLFKMGWSSQRKYGGGMQFRIGIGSQVENPNKSIFHLYVPKTFVPNNIANPIIKDLRTKQLNNLGISK